MRRFILALLLFVAGVTLPGGAQSATAQEVDENAHAAATPALDELNPDVIDPLTFYESPTFGYVIPWFDDIWHLESSDSGPDGDVVVFRQENDLMTFHGYKGNNGDPVACLNNLIGKLEQTSEASVEPGADEGGNLLAGGDDFHAWAVYVVASDGDGEDETVWDLECRRLERGSAVLAITLATTRDRYNGIANVLAHKFMNSVVMPNDAFDTERSDSQLILVGYGPVPAYTWDFPRPPSLLFDESGEEAGTATLVKLYDPNEEGAWYLYVQFENSGISPFTVDPLALTAIARSFPGNPETSEDQLRPTDYRWETGKGNPTDQKRVLGPGERAIVRVTFEPFFAGNSPGQKTYTAEYGTEPAQSVIIGAWDDSAGGGGRPRLGG